jgi:hypothetical protein
MRLNAKIGLLLFGLVGGLAFVEIAPRALGGLLPQNVRGLERVYAGRAKWEEMMVPDRVLGYRPKPGLDLLYPSEGRNIVVRTTSHGLGDIGFRDIGTSAPFDAIALGDSFTFCDDVPVDACWVRLVGERSGLSIATLGVSGFSTLAEARVLEQYGMQLHPKLVLLGLFPNDFNDNLRFSEWATSGNPDFWEWRKAREGRGVIRGWLASHSITYRLFDAVTRSRGSGNFRYQKNGLSLMLRTDRFLPDENREKERRNAWELMRTALLDMNRTAAASGARFAVILIPSKEEVYWDVVRQDLSAGAPADVDRPLGMVEGFCREQQIPVCDLRPVFQSQAKEYRQLYLRVSGHWNDAGNDLAATTIARCLASQGLVPPPHAIDPLARSARDR